MINEATAIAAVAVLGVVILSVYFTYRSLKRGGCSYCSGCPHKRGDPACGQCTKKGK